MNYNPYAAPQASPPQSPGAPRAGAPQPWEVGEVLSQAWNTFKANWAVLVFSFLVGPLQRPRPSVVRPHHRPVLGRERLDRMPSA